MDTTTMLANPDQARAWDGEEGDHWANNEEHYNAVGRRLDPHLFGAARIAPDERVLDIGCGCGLTTREAAGRAVSGLAVGVDLSRRMIERARENSRVQGLANVAFQQADAQTYPFQSRAFDVMISRFGAMFFADPVAAFTNIGRSMRPGARLALLSWQRMQDNEWLVAIREALAIGRTLPEPPVGVPGPFGLADPKAVRRILTDSAFENVALERVNERLWLGADATKAFLFVRGLGMTQGLLNGLDDASRARALKTLQDTLAAHDTADGVLFDSSAWLVTAHRP